MPPLPRPELLTQTGGSSTHTAQQQGASLSSSSSNNNNNNNNYGSIVVDGEERVPLVQMSMSQDSLENNNNNNHKEKQQQAAAAAKEEKKRILKIIVASLLLVTLLSLLFYFLAPLFPATTHNKNNVNQQQKQQQQQQQVDNPFWLHPVKDLGMISTQRQGEGATPSQIWSHIEGPLPTNSWYLNLVSHKAAQQPDESSSAYTVPYIIDTAAGTTTPIAAGIRIHWPVVQASTQNIQMVRDFKNSLTVGTNDLSSNNNNKNTTTNTTTTSMVAVPYKVKKNENGKPLSPLGVTLEWGGQSGEDNENNNNNNNSKISSKKITTNNKDNNKDDNSIRRRGRRSLSLSHQSTSSSSSTITTTNPASPVLPTMTTEIIRGMAYATMHYQGGLKPSIYSFNGLASDIRVDDDNDDSDNNDTNHNSTTTTTATTLLKCATSSSSKQKQQSGNTVTVQKHLHLHFVNSDFTWLVFFSRPVQVQCQMSDGDQFIRDFQLDVVKIVDPSTTTTTTTSPPTPTLTVRVALLNQCTTGKSNIQQHCQNNSQWSDISGYEQLLKDNVDVYPTSPQMEWIYNNDNNVNNNDNNNTTTTTTTTTEISIDWGAASSSGSGSHGSKSAAAAESKLLMFALPHHQELLQVNGSNNSNNSSSSSATSNTNHCIHTFHGRTCLMQGSQWTLSQNVGQPLSFWAPRPPSANMIPTLAEALSQDIHYPLSDNLMRGAADTYFSGKILARYARVIVIADELKQLADQDISLATLQQKHYANATLETLRASRQAAAAAVAKLPTASQIAWTVEQLKRGVRAWLDSNAEAPFVFDETWGGLVNCGCRYVGKDDHGYCNNTFPDCPALVDVNEDFGNGFYNDHHYHYGYHLYAAAVAAKFDPAWARQFMDDILLYIRDFANPVADDPYFPPFRQKDWYLGSSWASGIVSAENSPHGRNEESSSEAISAYEAMALFGSAMMDAYAAAGSGTFTSSSSSSNNKYQVAKLLQQSGQLLTATELEATNRYWHVWNSTSHPSTYPEAYQQPVVGMLYDTMAMFGTWFSQWPLVSYGIQLLPLTPVTERRDDPEWAALLYPQYQKACEDAGDFCVENGWSILQAGLLATAGDPEGALQQALEVPDFVFETQGGMGNSRTNTIWYIATRKSAVELSLNETR